MGRSPPLPILILAQLALALAAALAPAAASAQSVRGRVVEAQGDQPIARATVYLIDSTDKLWKYAIADSLGAFTITIEQPGRYRLRAERFGYATATTREVDLVLNDTLEVELLLGVDAVVIEPLLVTSGRAPLVLDDRLERRGYYRREAMYGTGMGFGIYLDHQQIQRRNPFRFSDLFRDIARMKVVSLGGRSVEVRNLVGDCVPTFYIDGFEFPLRRGDSIDEIVVPTSIAAMEVYPSRVGPAEYLGGRCGSVVIWTGVSSARGARN